MSFRACYEPQFRGRTTYACGCRPGVRPTDCGRLAGETASGVGSSLFNFERHPCFSGPGPGTAPGTREGPGTDRALRRSAATGRRSCRPTAPDRTFRLSPGIDGSVVLVGSVRCWCWWLCVLVLFFGG